MSGDYWSQLVLAIKIAVVVFLLDTIGRVATMIWERRHLDENDPRLFPIRGGGIVGFGYGLWEAAHFWHGGQWISAVLIIFASMFGGMFAGYLAMVLKDVMHRFPDQPIGPTEKCREDVPPEA